MCSLHAGKIPSNVVIHCKPVKSVDSSFNFSERLESAIRLPREAGWFKPVCSNQPTMKPAQASEIIIIIMSLRGVEAKNALRQERCDQRVAKMGAALEVEALEFSV